MHSENTRNKILNNTNCKKAMSSLTIKFRLRLCHAQFLKVMLLCKLYNSKENQTTL